MPRRQLVYDNVLLTNFHFELQKGFANFSYNSIDMQKTFLSIFMVLFVFCIGNTQIGFTPMEPSGASDACEIVQVDMDVNNVTAEEVRLKWRIDRVDVPEEWELQLCDAITCYAYGVEATPDGETRVNVFNPGQGYTYMFKAKPNSVNGIGDFDLVLFNADDETDIYSTIPIVVTITNCTSSTDDVNDGSNIGIYPNPSFGSFQLTELFDQRGETIKVLRLSKR